MKDFSQYGEQKVILEFFKNQNEGMLLDIGANDGVTLSNSHALMLKGWIGVLVEPTQSAFKRLRENYAKNERAIPCNVAIGEKTGPKVFQVSGEHLGKGDVGLLSTGVKDDFEKWKPHARFETETVKMETWQDFKYSRHGYRFDFITIDAEGMDLAILQQIDLREYQTKLICLEWNANVNTLAKMELYCNKMGFTMHYKNNCNVIFRRR
jgi:FkbM family methyltransferase